MTFSDKSSISSLQKRFCFCLSFFFEQAVRSKWSLTVTEFKSKQSNKLILYNLQTFPAIICNIIIQRIASILKNLSTHCWWQPINFNMVLSFCINKHFLQITLSQTRFSNIIKCHQLHLIWYQALHDWPSITQTSNLSSIFYTHAKFGLPVCFLMN